jgi:hypothetical protein
MQFEEFLIIQSECCKHDPQLREESGASNGLTPLALHIDSHAPYSGRKGFRSFSPENSILYNKSSIEPATTLAATAEMHRCRIDVG